MQTIQGILGAGVRLWVAQPGKEHDVAYCVRFDRGVPESIDCYCQLPPRMAPNEDAGYYEEQESADIPMADKDGWVSVGPGSFHVEQSSRGDVEEVFSSSLKSGTGKESK